MLAQYVEVEEAKQEAKTVTSVHFDSDYDITDVLTRWGNWARKDAYLQRKAFSLYKSENESKESLSDDDALVIDTAIKQLSNMKIIRSQYEHKVLSLYYYGDIQILDNTVMIKPKTLREIGKIIDCSEANVRKIKSSGESCVIGMIAMLNANLGVLNNIRILK